MKKHPSLRVKTAWNIFIVLVPLTILMAIAIHSLEQALERLYPSAWTLAGSFILFFLAMLLFVFLWLYWLAPRINRLSTAQAKEISRPDYPEIKYLVTGYSPFMPRKDGPQNVAEAVATFVPQHPSLEIACAKSPKGNYTMPWQQNLRIINAANTSGNLKKVLFVEPSMSQAEEFKKLIKTYFDGLEVEVVSSAHDQSVPYSKDVLGKPRHDYEDFDYVTGAISRAMQMIARDEQEELNDIEHLVAIDVTPGMKVFSIAAAIQSLNRNMVFLYAKTGEDSGKVMAYDASVTFTGSPG